MLLAMLVHRYRLIDHADYRLQIKETLTLKPDGLHPHPGPAHPRRPGRRPHRTADRGAAPSGQRTRPSHRTCPPASARAPGCCCCTAATTAPAATSPPNSPTRPPSLGCDTDVAPLDAYAGALPTDRPVVITAASYNGRPTDDAAAFVAWLEDARTGAADGVTYAVLGVGDRNWAATYQHIPTLIDDRLAALGATRLLRRAPPPTPPATSPAPSRQFTARLRTALLEHYGDPDATARPPRRRAGTAAYTVTEVTGGPLDALAARHGTRPDDRHRGRRPHRTRTTRASSASSALALPGGDRPTARPTTSPCCPPTPRTSSSGPPLLLGADLDTVLRTSAPPPAPRRHRPSTGP